MASLVAPMQRCSLHSHYTQTAAILAPFLQQTRSASILASLSDVKGAYNKRIRRGRGPSSGKGKTSGRGHGGQKQHGKVPAGFNGGQTPLEVVHGKRGFVNQFSLEMTTLNLDRVQQWIDAGRLDPSRPITVKELHASRCTHGIKDGIKLLARDASTLHSPIHITVSRASKAAIAAIEAAGGTVQTRYYTRNSIRRVLKGESHPNISLLSPPEQIRALTSLSVTPPAELSQTGAGLPTASNTSLSPSQSTALVTGLMPTSHYKYRLPDATSRKDIEYYRDPAHRGYLSHLLEEGQGPSLYFKTPAELEELAKRSSKVRSTKRGKSASSENMW